MTGLNKNKIIIYHKLVNKISILFYPVSNVAIPKKRRNQKNYKVRGERSFINRFQNGNSCPLSVSVELKNDSDGDETLSEMQYPNAALSPLPISTKWEIECVIIEKSRVKQR